MPTIASAVLEVITRNNFVVYSHFIILSIELFSSKGQLLIYSAQILFADVDEMGGTVNDTVQQVTLSFNITPHHPQQLTGKVKQPFSHWNTIRSYVTKRKSKGM